MINPDRQGGVTPNLPFVNGHQSNDVIDPHSSVVNLPEKQRDIEHILFDSRKWNLVMPYRRDDVVIASYPKSGTTWMQQIVRSLLCDETNSTSKNMSMHQVSPWVDHRKIADEDIHRFVVNTPFTTRRFLKTHLPIHALPTSSGDIVPAFIYVARDGRDVVWSWYNHHKSYTSEHVISMSKGWTKEPFPNFVAENLSESQYFERWLKRDGYPLWPFFEMIRGWWQVRNHPNVLLVHYNNLIRDRAYEIKRIHTFLAQHGRVEQGNVLENAVNMSSFDAMKADGQRLAPLGGAFLQRGGDSFFNKGTNGRWKNTLPEQLSTAYEEMAVKELGAQCSHWLATGEMR